MATTQNKSNKSVVRNRSPAGRRRGAITTKNNKPKISKELKKILDQLGDIQEWVHNGVSNRQIAKNLGISESTWYKHKAECSELSEAFSEAEKSLESERVTTTVNKMYERAWGHYVEETITIMGGNLERPQFKKIKKYIPGDSSLQRFIVKNRLGLQWKENPMPESGGESKYDRASIRRSIESKLSSIAARKE